MKRGEQAKLIRELKEEHNLNPSKTIISRMIKEKDYRIVLTPGGNIKIPETIKALLDSDFGKHGQKMKDKMDAKKGKPVADIKTKKTVKVTAADKEEKEETTEDESQPLSMVSTRARIEKHKAFQSAEKDRIANEIKLGLYHPRDEIEEKSFDLFRTIRDKSKASFEKLAIKIRSTDSNHEARQIAEKEHHKIFSSVIAEYNKSDEAVKKKLLQLLTGST